MSQYGQFNTTGSGAAAVETLTGNSGGAVSPDGAYNINVVGSGAISVAGNPGTNTLTISSSGNMPWNLVTMSTGMSVNNGYITNSAGLITLTLPAAATEGDIIAIAGRGSGGWSIAQNAGQTIYVIGSSTTTGITGSLSSTVRFDCIELICVAANTDFVARSVMGNITIV